MFYLISPAVFVAVLSQTEWSTWPPQHTTSWHQRNKAQTELVTCFGVFSPPSVQISTLGRDPTLLLLCPVHSVSLPHSLLQFHIIRLTPTHLSHLSHLLFRSSPSVSPSPSFSLSAPHRLYFLWVFHGSLVSFCLRVTWLCLSQPGKKKQWILGVFFN